MPGNSIWPKDHFLVQRSVQGDSLETKVRDHQENMSRLKLR